MFAYELILGVFPANAIDPNYAISISVVQIKYRVLNYNDTPKKTILQNNILPGL